MNILAQQIHTPTLPEVTANLLETKIDQSFRNTIKSKSAASMLATFRSLS